VALLERHPTLNHPRRRLPVDALELSLHPFHLVDAVFAHRVQQRSRMGVVAKEIASAADTSDLEHDGSFVPVSIRIERTNSTF
jgi:hypothetical protein